MIPAPVGADEWQDPRISLHVRDLPRRRPPRAARSGALCLLVALLASACGLTIPTDPEGNLAHIRSSKVLRVGASPRPGWVKSRALLTRRAASPTWSRRSPTTSAPIEWTVSREEHLVGLLEDGELDLTVGG